MAIESIPGRIRKVTRRLAISWKVGLTSILFAITFIVPMPAHGRDAEPGAIARKSEVILPLPANRYLETMPWLEWVPYRRGLKVDTLQLPRLPYDGVIADTPPIS
jgi:hypothetical protein